MNAISIGTLALSALYLLISYNRFGMTGSISATFYKWQEKDYSAAFVWFCLVITLGTWLQTIYPLKHDTKLILSLAGVFMFGIGIAATFRDAKVGTLHYVLAVLAILLGFLALYIEYKGYWKSWVPLSVFLLSIPVVRKFWPKFTTYIIEVEATTLIFACL